ncbi:uncharacterized protein A4U43_C08F19420 [Asparagus officinalis]|nr:uncharacterized protein A4U43_C08F19420 [Asparagus officinalis]
MQFLAYDNIDAASKEVALRATQDAADDPHILSRDENDAIAMNVMGLDLLVEVVVACRGWILTMTMTRDFLWLDDSLRVDIISCIDDDPL